jgi:hypothetical protein
LAGRYINTFTCYRKIFIYSKAYFFHFTINSKIGLQPVPSLSSYVPSQLNTSAHLAGKAAVDFGETIEKVLVKHGKRITGKEESLKSY